MNDAALYIKLPAELKQKLEKEAQDKNISVASLIRLILSERYKG
jgi:hypothetical protein